MPAKRSAPTWQIDGRGRHADASAAATTDGDGDAARAYHQPRALGSCASAASSASIDGQRCAGSVGQAAQQRAPHPAGHAAVGRRRAQAAAACTLSASSAIVAPANGRSPYSASYSATQKLN